MEQVTTYSVKIRNIGPAAKKLSDTAGIYRRAVDFFINVCLKKWDHVSAFSQQKERVNAVEALTVKTKKRASVPCDFGIKFYKFPAYLRRAAISAALGKVSSYMGSLKNRENTDPDKRGRRPGLPRAGNIYPAMYKDNMFVRTGTYTAAIKVYNSRRRDWEWLDITLDKKDADYILRNCGSRTECVPTMQKRHKGWYLDFAFKEKLVLPEINAADCTVIAVDLGINNACTICAMRPDGTVTGRKFLKLRGENDRLEKVLGRIRKAQRNGARRTPHLWAKAKGISRDIAVKTAEFIVRTAAGYGAAVIVMEHLDLKGKKRGGRKQRLHHWRAQYVQAMVTQKAHRRGIRFARVCAWNTSRLAYDGSGRVKRGSDSEKTKGNYSVCEFSTGKVYNCDLNAGYNIGSRYFVREILKTLPATAGRVLAAKVPSALKRSTCTLSTLITLNAVAAGIPAEEEQTVPAVCEGYAVSDGVSLSSGRTAREEVLNP